MARVSRNTLQLKLALRRALRGLRRMYGPVEAPRPRRGLALDTLVEAMLAQNTSMVNAERGYRMLRRRFASWRRVMAAPVGDVQREIAVCGLSRMRARRLQAMLRLIDEQRGGLSVDFLRTEPTEAAYAYLMSFHGIGPKTAAFTLLFGCGHPLLPVDNAVLRVLRRLRLVRPKARDAEAQRVLSPLIPDGDHYAAHVLLFRHGKERCRPKNPKCDECALLRLCPHGRRVVRHRPPERGAAAPVKRRRPMPLARFISAGIVKNREEE